MRTLPFSYIWLKYDILVCRWYRLRGRLVTACGLWFPRPVSTLAGTATTWVSSTKILRGTVRFASKPCIAVRVGAAMPVWGIAISHVFFIHSAWSIREEKKYRECSIRQVTSFYICIFFTLHVTGMFDIVMQSWASLRIRNCGLTKKVADFGSWNCGLAVADYF